MTATTSVLDESCRLTKTSSPERPFANVPEAAETIPQTCLVIEIDASRPLEADLPPRYKRVRELTKRFEQDARRKAELAKARKWLAKYKNEGVTLRSLRLKKGLSQASLAAKVGSTQAHVARLEAGRTDAQMTTVVRLAKALDVDPTELFEALIANQQLEPAP